MARIRSVHPGQWTDDAFVSLSMAARLLTLALRNEADDFGAFEWNIAKLKIRLLPMDNVDMPTLMGELEAAQQVQKYEIDGRQYGLIRNFRRYQRPKFPKPTYPLPDNYGKYIGLSPSDEEITDDDQPPKTPKTVTKPDQPKPFPPKAEIPPQMEEVLGSLGDSAAIAADAGASAEPEILPPDRGEMPDIPGFLDRRTRPAPEPPDPKKIIFDQGLAWLSERTNKPPDRLRSYLGKLCRDHGDAMTSAAIVDAQKNSPVDPISWMERFLNGKQKSGDLGQRRSLAAAFLGADP